MPMTERIDVKKPRVAVEGKRNLHYLTQTTNMHIYGENQRFL